MKSINISNDGNSVSIDGVIYDKRKTEPKEPGLKTFEDCWNKVKPIYWNKNSNSEITSSPASPVFYPGRGMEMNLPSEKTARQIQTAIKLFVVWAAINGEWYPDTNENAFYIYYSRYENDIHITVSIIYSTYHPYPFKTRELAQKAIDIAKDIWLEYFGIENQK
jgi:hypothetical protein